MRTNSLTFTKDNKITFLSLQKDKSCATKSDTTNITTCSLAKL